MLEEFVNVASLYYFKNLNRFISSGHSVSRQYYDVINLVFNITYASFIIDIHSNKDGYRKYPCTRRTHLEA